MISDEFNNKGELIFEIGLIAADGDVILVKALLDTGFTGLLAIDNQDAESLGWFLDSEERRIGISHLDLDRGGKGRSPSSPNRSIMKIK